MIIYEIIKRNNKKTGVSKVEWEKKERKLNNDNELKILSLKRKSRHSSSRSSKLYVKTLKFS